MKSMFIVGLFLISYTGGISSANAGDIVYLGNGRYVCNGNNEKCELFNAEQDSINKSQERLETREFYRQKQRDADETIRLMRQNSGK
jgi:hypothetical protein